jgi:superfamily II DNA or RNA helicase/HKD family nuclease
MAEHADRGGNLFIVDNSDDEWKVHRYLRDWCEIAESIDIATGYFEIGALTALDGQWQKLDKIRILLGDQVTKRTRAVLLAQLEERARQVLDNSLEAEKDSNDFLTGVAAIEEAMRSGKIECRVYAERKFHAKAYITHGRLDIVGSAALVGSSNFTAPGLMQNVELNVQVKAEVDQLQEWFEHYWNDAEPVTAELLQVIERHTREYTPFEVYAKSLQEYFKGHEVTAGEWELSESKMYPVLAQYQKEGYGALMKIAGKYGGALLCDGVGLGKTFIGLMLIERLVMFEGKRVALIVPKAARKPVWESKIQKYLPHLLGDFSSLVVFNETDLSRAGEWPAKMDRIAEMADVVVIDEAHHFRNPGIKGTGEKKASRYWRLYDLTRGKQLFMLTATPINNRLLDLQHMIELFSHEKVDYFAEAPLGIHSLAGHFRKLEHDLQADLFSAELDEIEVDHVAAESVLFDDALFRGLVVQRSRAYVHKSVEQEGGGDVVFPDREDPKVAEYSIEKTYGRLLGMLEKAFSKEKPLFSLAMYYPLFYYCGPDDTIDPLQEGRQKQVVGLIRLQFLKRFESSVYSFQSSLDNLLVRLFSFAEANVDCEPRHRRRLETWKARNDEIIKSVWRRRAKLAGVDLAEVDEDDDITLDEMLEDIEALSPVEYKMDEMLDETMMDLEQVVDFLQELRNYDETHDDKLRSLLKLLATDPILSKHKAIIFTEFMTTARYLKEQLQKAGIEGVDEIDSSDGRDRGEVIRRFSPYYNDTTSTELEAAGQKEIRLLVSTDVLSEGLNLQDATRLINYDLHWNPVRLMQRIGRVDRRLDPKVEELIVRDHPDVESIRATAAYWNFLPPAELNRILTLYKRVSHKTLLISKVFGIEGRKLLTPDDDFDALKDFKHSYEGEATLLEALHLEYQALVEANPDLLARLSLLPGRVFSGKETPKPDTRGVFFCYALPAPQADDGVQRGELPWTEEAGSTLWCFYDMQTERVVSEVGPIAELIRSTPETPRRHAVEERTLSEIRTIVEKHIKNTCLKKVQAPVGVKAALKAWMEVS